MSPDHFPNCDLLSWCEDMFLIVVSESAVVVCSICLLVVISSDPESEGLEVSARLLLSVGDFVGSGLVRGGCRLRGQRSPIVQARYTKDKNKSTNNSVQACV